VYLYKNAEGEVIYVGKAKSLRHRVSSYFHEGRVSDSKTGTLLREAVDVDYIVVANNKEALALENHLIKQKKPRFNILLRDDKTYPYVKLTLGERLPRVYVTRRLRKDGSVYYGPYFPANLAYRIVDLIHRSFLVPSCYVDLNRSHPRPCLQFYIGRCLGPCVEGLTTPEIYHEAVRDVKLFLDGRQAELAKSLRERMNRAAEAQEFERAAKYRDLISTVEQLREKQRIAAAEGDDADVFGYHFENGMLAVNLFTCGAGVCSIGGNSFGKTCRSSNPRMNLHLNRWGQPSSAILPSKARQRRIRPTILRSRAPPDSRGRQSPQQQVSIPRSSSRNFSPSSISGSLTFPEMFTFLSTSKTVKPLKKCFPSSLPEQAVVPLGCTLSCLRVETSAP
jgi:hypothetical protein